jgi:dTDP-4-amino-4,6-dideoxygalactose transaminase
MTGNYNRNLQVPILDLTAQHEQLEPELSQTIQEVVQDNAFILGEELEQFESEFASYCDAEHCAGVSSGTDALKLALHAAGVGEEDEVITVPVTFIATVEAICSTGADPVLVDVDPDTYTMDPDRLEDAITDRTAAVVPVHLYGQPADMTAIRNIADQHDLTVVTDACQAHGARWDGDRTGGLGDLACFSFYPGKNIGALGDAGCVTTDRASYADRLKALRNHGQREGEEKYRHRELGYNARMDNLHAAVLRLKLEHLDRWNEERRSNAATYDEMLGDVPGVVTPYTAGPAEHVYHQYTIRVEHRERAQEFMGDRGVQCGTHYPRPLHMQDACSFLDLEEGDLPASEHACSRVLTLPCFPELSEEQQRHVVKSLKSFVAGREA